MSEEERKFLEIVDLKKGFGSGETRQEVLRGMNFSVAKGEFCVLLGPSGSGKSTLLNIIGGIDSADSGYISINGDKLKDMSEKKLTQYRRKHLGYVFQMYNLIANLNVKENIDKRFYWDKKDKRILFTNATTNYYIDKKDTVLHGGDADAGVHGAESGAHPGGGQRYFQRCGRRRCCGDGHRGNGGGKVAGGGHPVSQQYGPSRGAISARGIKSAPNLFAGRFGAAFLLFGGFCQQGLSFGGF